MRPRRRVHNHEESSQGTNRPYAGLPERSLGFHACASDGLLVGPTITAATEIREAGDRGTPIVVAAPNHPAGKAFIQIAEILQKKF